LLLPDFETAPFFVVRAPVLPLDEWLAFVDGMQAAPADAAGLEAALLADRALARLRLRAIVERPLVREAMFVASPSLDEAIDHWLRDPSSERGVKAERTLMRYFARMCSRPTPFGLFAGCTVGSIGDTTVLRLGALDRCRRHTRLDMDYVFALCESLARDPELRPRLRHHVNSSLYPAARRLRYAEARLDGQLRSYHLVAIERDEHLDALIADAAQGATLSELASRLAVRAEVSPEEARAFVEELVDNQVLVPELQLPVTGPEPMGVILQKLGSHPAAKVLTRTQERLDAIDREPLGIAPKRYRDIAAELGELPVPAELSRLFQVDLISPADELQLGKAVLDEMRKGIALLHRLARPSDRLRAFREAFADRYEGAEVPLAEALDEDSGIGFEPSEAPSADASPLLEGLAFPAQPGDDQVVFGTRERLLVEKLASGAREIRLESSDVDAMAATSPQPLPDSLGVLATIMAPSEAALAAGDFRIRLAGGGGPPGARLLGRFCHGDERLTALVRDYLAREERTHEGAIFAEIVHLPEGRIGNTLLRPLLREWELPYLGASGAPPERQIPLGDLMVSVRGGRVVLRSRRLGREIIPRLTTAHNYGDRRYLGIYRFLSTLQVQGVTPWLTWGWGALDAFPFLPRVVCGRLILSLARWRLGREQLRALGRVSGAAQFTAVQALRRQLNLPRMVALQDSDNILPIDLDHVLSVETFVQLVKDRDQATLIETLSEDRALSGPGGGYVHELVVPFVRTKPAPALAAPAPVSASVVRRQMPGSSWLTAKLYAGAATLDDLLRGLAAPLTRQAMESGAAARWFFVRYSDPGWHLRLRLEGDPERLRAEVEPALHEAAAPFVADGSIHRITFDTYHREIERYGGAEGMALSERVFHADSEAVLAIVELLEGDAGADARWRLALYGIDRLLGDLGLDLEQKRSLMAVIRQRFGAEFAVDTRFEKQLGDRFRRERSALETLIAPEHEPDHPLAPGLDIFATRSAALRPMAAELAAAAPITEVLPSLAHMHANRMLRSSQRAQELVIYDFLLRLYESQLARRRKSARDR
jgi:thiopeptide-type bacteriocin biosynthesis protein